MSAAPVERLDLTKVREHAEEAGEQEKTKTLVSRTHEFEVRYTDPDGDPHQHVLSSKILSGPDRNIVARMAAIMAGCVFAHLPVNEQNRFLALSRVEVAVKEQPDWVQRWIGEDDVLLGAIFGEVEAHRLEYFPGDVSEGMETAVKSRVQIRSTSTADAGDS